MQTLHTERRQAALDARHVLRNVGLLKQEKLGQSSAESAEVSVLMWQRANLGSCGSRGPLFQCAGIRQRLMRGCCDAGAVLGDVSLVWQNCRGFNAEGSDIHAMADEAEAHFVQLWARKDLSFEATAPPTAPPSAGQHGSVQVPTGQRSSAKCLQWSTPLEGTWGAFNDARDHVMIQIALCIIQGPAGCLR